MKRLPRLAKRYLLDWLPLAFAITVMAGLVYAAVQQSVRQSANAPQLQMITDITAALSSGQDTQGLLPGRTVDIDTSLTPFVIVYDSNGQAVTSTASLDNETPVLPKGVLDYSRTHTDDRLTWQPKAGVRIATVVEHYQSNKSSGFVLVGRNLREVERLESQILILTAGAWVVALVGSLGIVMVIEEAKL